MDSEKMQRINELILDEEKIVTNISLINELKITPSEAQNLLKSFTKQHNNLQITYLLSGVLLDSKCFCVNLIKKINLEEKKKEFEIISNEIIYSIQKSQDIDFSLIASTDSGYTNGVNLLTSKNSIKRNIVKNVVVSEPAAIVKKSAISAFASFKSSDSSNSENSQIGSRKEEQEAKNNDKIGTQISQKQQQKSKKGGIANFFSKATPKPHNVVTEPEVIINEDLSPKEYIKNDEKMEVDDVEEKQESLKEEKDIQVNKSTSKSSKKRRKNNKTDGPNKKRKRIQQICDSDSDDIFGETETETGDIIEMSDEEPSASVVTQIPKKKVRKAIDKVYADEDGFIVTKTEYIYESEPEDEIKEMSETKTKPEQKISLEKKNENKSDTKAPTGKGKNNKKQINGKQPTLMSFFKKA